MLSAQVLEHEQRNKFPSSGSWLSFEFGNDEGRIMQGLREKPFTSHSFIMFADRLHQVTPSLHCHLHIHHQQQGWFRQNGLRKSSPPGDFHTDFQETIPSGFPQMDDGNLPQQIPKKPISSGFPHMDGSDWCSSKAIDPIKSRRMIKKTAQCSGTALGWRITRSVQKRPESVIPGPLLRLEGTSQNDDPSYPWQEIEKQNAGARWSYWTHDVLYAEGGFTSERSPWRRTAGGKRES